MPLLSFENLVNATSAGSIQCSKLELYLLKPPPVAAAADDDEGYNFKLSNRLLQTQKKYVL